MEIYLQKIHVQLSTKSLIKKNELIDLDVLVFPYEKVFNVEITDIANSEYKFAYGKNTVYLNLRKII